MLLTHPFYSSFTGKPIADARGRLLAHPAVQKSVEGARPYRKYFPLGAPDRD